MRCWKFAANSEVEMGKTKNPSVFSHAARWFAKYSGRPVVFFGAVSLVVVWAAVGPIFGFSDTWQLVINTGTTIITFLMVFMIQNTQNRDTEAMQIKLDEIIRSIAEAHDDVIDLEDRDEEELDQIRKEYTDLANRERKNDE